MVVWPVVLHTTVMLVFWLMSVTCSGSCPDHSALREALTCLHNLTEGDNSKISIDTADILRTKSFCENGNFADSVGCLRRLYSSCRDPVKIENLKKYADPNAWEAGFQRLCYSMSLYVQKADCIKIQSQEIQECVDSQKDVTVSSGAGAMYSIDKDERQYVKNVCGLFQISNHCFSSRIGQCGEEIQAVLTDFYSGLTPPICRDFSIASFNSGRRTNSAQSLVALWTCVVLCFLTWMTSLS